MRVQILNSGVGDGEAAECRLLIPDCYDFGWWVVSLAVIKRRFGLCSEMSEDAQMMMFG